MFRHPALLTYKPVDLLSRGRIKVCKEKSAQIKTGSPKDTKRVRETFFGIISEEKNCLIIKLELRINQINSKKQPGILPILIIIRRVKTSDSVHFLLHPGVPVL
jgi:hypothetical protein